jgi:hypothetical protein
MNFNRNILHKRVSFTHKIISRERKKKEDEYASALIRRIAFPNVTQLGIIQ